MYIFIFLKQGYAVYVLFCDFCSFNIFEIFPCPFIFILTFNSYIGFHCMNYDTFHKYSVIDIHFFHYCRHCCSEWYMHLFVHIF